MHNVVISGSGLYTPPGSISNDELVESFNTYARGYNAEHAEAIAAGAMPALAESSSEFILKASGIKNRHVVDKAGVLDPAIMAPRLAERGNEELSLMAEMAVVAAREALDNAGRQAVDIDLVIVAASNLQRAYPAIAIEVQNALGCGGYAYDMNVACSSATFGLQAAADALRAGSARGVLVINPEICSGHLNFRDRDSHFIFGDACTALVLEREADAGRGFRLRASRCKTVFSNNIRNNFGFLNRAHPESRDALDKLFMQQGRKVFKEVCPMVAELILDHLASVGWEAADLKRLWLHQANINMNQLIAHRVLGREPSPEEAPIILDEYANTSSAGSVIAFHRHHADLRSGDKALLCSFGAGYSVGCLLMERL
ncbi:MAG: beta-ketoacyl-ACP synthase III [Gammaproteobacteria bacterium]|nr:beta-ketoacyl-ACP synthase III [Gammaproteobacteria bacterium]